jgi:hypothetical protein
MNFIVDESGCKKLCAEMLKDVQKIFSVVNEIQNHDRILQEALGDRYELIAKEVRMISSEITNAGSKLMVLVDDMQEYTKRVKNIGNI